MARVTQQSLFRDGNPAGPAGPSATLDIITLSFRTHNMTTPKIFAQDSKDKRWVWVSQTRPTDCLFK